MVKHVLLGMALMVGACGGDDEGSTSSSGNGGAGGSTASSGGGGGSGGGVEGSTLTVSGALTGTRSGPRPGASYGKDNGIGAFVLLAQSDPPFWASIGFNFEGEPIMTTYTEADTTVQCGVSVTDATTPTNSWTASKGVVNEPDRGTCSLTLTSITLDLETDTQKQYTINGSMVAVLPVYSGTGRGDVTLEATF